MIWERLSKGMTLVSSSRLNMVWGIILFVLHDSYGMSLIQYESYYKPWKFTAYEWWSGKSFNHMKKFRDHMYFGKINLKFMVWYKTYRKNVSLR